MCELRRAVPTTHVGQGQGSGIVHNSAISPDGYALYAGGYPQSNALEVLVEAT